MLTPAGWAAWSTLAVAAAAAPAEKTGKPWLDMDYGPFITASIEAPYPEGNIAQKGIAVRLAGAFGGERNEAVVFDTDLLRYSAGWTGGYVALKGVVYDGEHWAFPRISGEQAFGTRNTPGWARAGSFEDPRPIPYGPLPREWARWKGLYLHENRVIFSYTVGETPILEMPGLEKGDGVTAFSRTLNAGQSTTELTMEVLFDDRADGRISPDGRLVTLSPRARKVSTEDGLIARWDFEEGGGDTARPATRKELAWKLRGHSWADGHDGAGIAFSGAGQGELVSTSVEDGASRVDFLETDLTISAWIRADGDGTIVSSTAPESPWVPDGKAFFVRGGRLAFDVGWVGCVEGRREVADGRWHHAALTWSHSSGRARLFAGGELDGEGILKPKGAVKGETLRIGAAAPDFPKQSRLRGSIDGFTIHGRALDAAEVRVLAGKVERNLTTAAAFRGLGAGARWIVTPEGHVRLGIPAAATPAKFVVLIWNGEESALQRFASLERRAEAMEVGQLTHGGPARWGEKVVTRGSLGRDDGPYAIDTLTSPDENPWRAWMRHGGFDFFADASSAALSTWSGDVWIVSGIDSGLEKLTWQRIATGLYQPLGLKVVDDKIFVLGRDQITRLHDLNGDGETDFYEGFNNDHQNTEHFHEFAMDLQTDARGNFYYMKAARHARDALVPQHGTLVKVAKDGSSSEILANGFRAPNGLLITPPGEIFSTDQQGFWLPANRINRIAPGSFHGNMWSYHRGAKPVVYDQPLCWLHPSIDRSPSTLAWVSSANWGPLQNRLVSVSYGMGEIFLVMRDGAGGPETGEQGAVTPFPLEFDTGIHRARFHPAGGQLYLCGLYGWAGNKTRPGGFYRVRYTGKPLQMPCDFHVASDGIVLGFTDPLDPGTATDPGSYSVKCWNYRWTENYGSPDVRRDGKEGRDTLEVESATASADSRTVFLKIAGITPVMQIHVALNLKAATGEPIRTFVHGTLHAVSSEPGIRRLGSGAIVGKIALKSRLAREAPGLALTFRAPGTREPRNPVSDTRVARLVALHVPAGSPPTPFLEPGPFECAWEGFLKPEIDEARSFDVQGRGTVEVEIAGNTVLEASGDDLHAGTATPVPLEQGLNRIRVTYRSPATGDSELRLYWSGGETPRGPVPPEALVHDADKAELREGDLRRRARTLFAEHRCVRCHAPEAPPGESAMPELAADAPSLEGVGGRLREAWMAGLVSDPVTFGPHAGVARWRVGEVAGWAAAKDIAAFLSHGASTESSASVSKGAAPFETDAVNRDEELEVLGRGKGLWGGLGCFACHSLPGDATVSGADDPRVPLGHVKRKWQREALVEYLLEPQKRFRSTRMPDFHLKRDEAEALAAFLLARSEALLAPAQAQAETPGDPERGRELAASLGCAACHAIPGVKNALHAPPLRALAASSHATGCLAGDPAATGQAPHFGFDARDHEALQRFVKTDLRSLARDAWPEIAERHVAALRCGACHERDGKTDTWLELSPPEGAAEDPAGTELPGPAQTIHLARPPLTWAGEKLRPEWIERLAGGTLAYKPRPRLEARMPAFPAYARGLALGLAIEHGFPPATPARAPADASLSALGRALTRPGAFTCVQCHPTGPEGALAGPDTETIPLERITDRLRKDFYDRFLLDPQAILPGTMMPRYTTDSGGSVLKEPFDGDAARQFDAIWHYLRSVESTR